MDTSHEYTSDDATPAKTKPKLFSMAQSQALLESKRMNTSMNTSHLSEQHNVLNTSRMRMDPVQAPRKSMAQAVPRISLSHLLSNHTQARTTTPVSVPRSSAQVYHAERRDNEIENVNSSPAFTPYESPDRAYIQQNRPFSAAPNSQQTLRLSALYHAPEKPRQHLNDTSSLHGPMVSTSSTHKPQGNLKEKEFFQYFSSTLSENEQLHVSKQHLEAMNAQLSRELEDYRSNLSVINDQLSSATSEVKTLRPALALAREQLSGTESEITSLKANYSSNKEELDAVRAETKTLKEEHMQERIENERLRASVETAKKGIAKLLIEYAVIGENFRELKKGYDLQQVTHIALVKEAEATKSLANSGLSALQPMLNDNNTMARAEDTKAILRELHNDLLASQQVTDLLRNKLHHQSSQLADAQSRTRELEEEKRGSMQELLTARQDAKREYKMLIAVEGRVEELSARLAEREKESIEVLASAAVREIELKAAKERIEHYEVENGAQSLELVSLRKVKEENVSSLLALQDVINIRDRDIISLKAEVKALNESKSELRALLAENKKNLAETETELRKRDAVVSARDREIVALTGERKALADSKAEVQMLLSETKKALAEKVAELKKRDPNEDLLFKIRELETRCSSLKTALEESQEQSILRERSSKQAESQLAKKLQDMEKSNAELAFITKSLKESSDKAHDQVKSVQVELKETLNAASTAKERCSAMEREGQDQRQRLLADIAAAKAELTKVQEELNTVSTKASTAGGKCSVLEANIKKAEKESKAAREGLLAEIADLKSRLEIQSVSLFQSKEACSLSKQEAASLKERIAAAGEQREALQVALESTQKRASTAETAVTLAQAQAAEAKQSLKQAESKLTSLTRELAEAQKAANKVKDSANLKSDELVKKMEKKIADLQDTNVELSARADALWARYKDGKLSDKEKEFISYLVNEAESIHEEDAVRKDNELRRREHTIQALNAKVAELQASVARFIKRQGLVQDPASKSIVSIKAWLSSSPAHGPPEDNIEDIPDPLPTEINANRPSLADLDDDIEDDTPLSELSKLSDIDHDKTSKKRARPASPVVAEESSHSKRRTASFTVVKNSVAAGHRALNATVSASPLESKVAKAKSKKQRK